jgi:CelD/BcsL family acetyltransferase involved in cellulose biosynthesis
VSVRELDPADDPRWERFVAARSDALVFHHPAWLRAVCRAQGYESLVLAHHDLDGRLDGVLPLAFKRGWVTGRRLVSLPHTPVAGPLAAADQVAADLSTAALQRARDRGARLELKTRARALDGACPDLQGVEWSTTFVLTLPGEAPEQLRFGNSRNHRRIRWAVGKAEREGVQVRDAESVADVQAWHALYLSTMRTHAIPPRSLRFFAALWDDLRPLGMLRLVLAEQGRRLLAGSVFLMLGSTVFYAYNGRRRDALALRPNDLIQWRAIHDAARAGFRRYDFGEVEDDQHGLAEFKAKWGAEPEPLYRYMHPPPGRATDRQALAHVHRWGERLWRRLPLAATARVGDLVYRRL